MVSGTWLVVPRPSSVRLTFRYEARATIHSNCSEWQFVSPFYLILHFSEYLLSVNAKTDPEISAQSCQSPHICKGYLPRSQELDEGFG